MGTVRVVMFLPDRRVGSQVGLLPDASQLKHYRADMWLLSSLASVSQALMWNNCAECPIINDVFGPGRLEDSLDSASLTQDLHKASKACIQRDVQYSNRELM